MMTSLFNVSVNVQLQPTKDVLKSLSKKRAGSALGDLGKFVLRGEILESKESKMIKMYDCMTINPCLLSGWLLLRMSHSRLGFEMSTED